MSDADVKTEIIRRSIQAAVAYGKKGGHEASLDATTFVHSLRLSNPDLGRLSIFWIPSQRNLRVRLTIPEWGHLGSKSVVDVRSNVGSRRSKDPLWSFPDRNDLILDALKALMVLDDLADV